jgi:isoleucyl-tRNA synthetase
MGVHHAWGRTLKDILQRYWAMRGRDQRYQNGFDCQGLWVEVEVERELGFTSKRDIEQYGVAEFVQRCKDRVARFADTITDESIRLGCWMDWPNSYYTLSDQNNYAIWHFLQQCHRRGLIYPGTDVMPWCPRCGTGLSQQEIQEGYREVVHPGLVVRLPLRGRDREFLLVWTTTPWTLTANVACAVNPDATYARVRQGDDTYYLAAARTSEVLTSDRPWRVAEEVPGRELLGLTYTGPFDDLPLAREAASARRTIPWPDASEAEGTGIVHIAPGCGKEDYDLSRRHGLPSLVPIDENGRMLPALGPFAGKPASDLADEVAASLRARGLLYRVDDHRHRYPHCWRCGSELLFRLVDEWFIAMDPWRGEIAAVAERVNWIPSWGRDVELDWLRNMRDWMVSKKRYWGLALPIWRCDCGWFDVIGGRDELRRRAAEGWDEFDGHSPHRPWVDAVKVSCETCGALASRIPDVGNPWLDAGIVAYSTMAYFEDRDEWRRWFPADLVVESLPGQFRLWFYSLLAMSTMLEAEPPVRTIMGHDLVLDEHGEEMHKSKGNAIWFSEAADAVGADAVRWLSAAQPLAQPLRFGFSAAEDVRAWLRTLWNVYHFLATYANVDGWPPPGAPPPDQSALPALPLDRWLRARTADAAQTVAAALESLDTPRATAGLLSFLDDLSNWWVRRSRRRFWRSQSDAGKQSAYAALWTALHTFTRLLAPFLPFTAEALHQRLASPFGDRLPESVHLCPFPAPEPDPAGRALLDECALARRIVRLGRAARADAGLRVRQPLARAFVLRPAQSVGDPLPNFEHDVLEELNVKRLEFVADRDVLGPASAEEGDLAVGLDTHLTDDLLHEGIARDLVRHIQNLRKRAGLRVDQRIALWLRADGPVAAALHAHADAIASETLATCVDTGAPPPDAARAEPRVAGSPTTVALLPTE